MKESLIDLGFAEAHLPPGTHICQIYTDRNERNEALLNFLLKGLELKNCNACFSENIGADEINSFFEKKSFSYADALSSGDFTLNKTSEVYFSGGKFDPDYMLELLKDFYFTSKQKGYSGARVIGEMSSLINHVPGGERLLEYESRVSMLLRDHPITTVCQYDAHVFDGGTIMDVLKVHPMMVVNGAVIHNPFYIPPEEFLKQTRKNA